MEAVLESSVNEVPVQDTTSEAGLDVVADREYVFEYTVAGIPDMQVISHKDEKDRPVVDHIIFNGEELQDSYRFWVSLYATYGFNSAIFNYFSHAEVFTRIAEVNAKDHVRLCIERDVKTGKGVLLATSQPGKPVVDYSTLTQTLREYGGSNVTYSNGKVTSLHIPPRNDSEFKIGGDLIKNRYLMSTPIDGYGKPCFFLSLLRTCCNNLNVAMTTTFRQELGLGKATDDVRHALVRALEGFNNDEGYDAVRKRFESAAASWASVYEVQQVYEMLVKMHSGAELASGTPSSVTPVVRGSLNRDREFRESEDDVVGSPILRAFHGLTGDVCHLYGMANVDSLSAKRQRALPVKCTVYDLFNFMTEVSTHYASADAERKLWELLGTMMSTEYDLEGSVKKFPTFSDYHISTRITTGLTGS